MEPNLPLTWYTVTEWSGVPADHFMVFSNPEWQWCIQWLISGGGGGGVCVCVCGGGGVQPLVLQVYILHIESAPWIFLNIWTIFGHVIVISAVYS